jgi:2-polyprenyl-6-methoxyphenol hydroxylase-like FAD-dependent oxidoreductase
MILQSWLLAHRVHLHTNLKRAAISPKGKGLPAKLHTSSRITDVDTESAIVFLENGESIQGDVIIGADGVSTGLNNAVCKMSV